MCNSVSPSFFFRFAILVAVLVTLSARTSSAADPPVAAGSANANMVAKIKGTIKGFQRGVLLVTRDDGTDVMVQPPAKATSFTFVAEAKPAFLQRGMLVRFKGSFNANGVPTAPINKIEIFQPINLKSIPGHSREAFTPGVHPEDKHGKKNAGVANDQIVGTFTGVYPNGTVFVKAGNVPVTATVVPNVQLQIRYNNLSLVKEGDAISVAGFYNPPDDTKIRGDQITITTDRVYGEPVEPTPATRKTRRTRDTKKDAGSATKDAGSATKNADNLTEKAAPAKADAAE